MASNKDVIVLQDCYNIVYYLLDLYCDNVCNLLDSHKFTCDHAHQLVNFMYNIVTSPSCSFERRKCKIYELIGNIAKMFSKKSLLKYSFEKDEHGNEFFLFIGTIGQYAIDLVLYTELNGNWIVLSDGSCIRNCKTDCCSDLTYAVSKRKQECAYTCETYEAIDEEPKHCFVYDAAKDECKKVPKSDKNPEISIVSPDDCDKVPCCFRLDLDLVKACEKKKDGQCPINVEVGSKHLPKGYKIRISAKKCSASNFETLGEFSSIGHFVVNLCSRDKGYYDILVELVAITPAAEEVVSSDKVHVSIHSSEECSSSCKKDKCDWDSKKSCKKTCKKSKNHYSTDDDWDCYSTYRS